MRDLLSFFLLPLVRPRATLARLLAHPHRLGLSLLVFLFLGVIYTASVQLAYSRGLGAQVEPFLKIPAADYYAYQRFFQLPFFLLTSVLFAGVARLVAVPLGGQGRFEDLLCVAWVAQTLPMFLTMWLPETILFGCFPGTPIRPVWLDVARQVAGIGWPVAIMVVGIAQAERFPWPRALLAVLAGAVPMTALMVIFVR
jgi:hypothetical protein